jgi:hypothetical protein
MSWSNSVIFRVAIVALLLFAQQVAISHQTRHALDRESSQTQQTAGTGNYHSNLCGFHAAFDGLHSAVKSTPPALFIGSTVFEWFAASPLRHYAAKPFLPASRGPPLL